jgi:biotin carboxyl carrier protein
MSEISGKVAGKHELTWVSAPRGPSGTARVRVGTASSGSVLEIRWRRDGDGLWIEFPDRTRGYDFEGAAQEDGRIEYRVSERTGAGEWIEQSFLRAGDASLVASTGAKKKGLRIRAQMPGRILRVLAKTGQSVVKGQSLLVMEAMKMENEIKAPADAVVRDCKAAEGQAVETGADLLLLEPS